MERVSKENYYLDIAQMVAERSTCLRRCYGSIIVKDDTIVSTGYNGAPRGRRNCSDLSFCMREKLGIPRGERYEMCRALHSEMNAVIAAPRERMLGATMYMCCTDPATHEILSGTCSCPMCKRVLINAGIETLVVREDKECYSVYAVRDWIENDDSLTGEFGY